ncbi:hypothetical protein TB2_026687 [Malus domestica]
MFAHLSGKCCDWGFISAISIQLSASGQHEKTKEMYNKVVEDVIVEQLPEESEEDLRVRTFTELFRKLPFPDQNHFLSTIIKKFKRERQIGELVSWFSTQLDASDQQELIGELVHVKADDETITNEDLVQRTKLLWPVAADEQLCDGVIGVIIEKLEDESEADFKLRRFTELCKKVVDFGVQVQFLDSVVQKLLEPRRCLPHGVLLQPQDSASAAELLWQLSSFGFSLLSIDDQQDKIKQISNKISAEAVKRQRLAGESEEDLRQKTFTMLFNKAPVSTRVNLFEELTDKFFGERRLCESILLFRQHGSNDQQEKIEEMFGDSGRLESKDAKNVILEKLDEESEEDFRLRRFIKLCSTDTCLLDVFLSEEDEKRNSKGLQLQKSGYEEIDKIKQFRYAEFYIGLSVIWFKTQCAKHPRNPVEVLVSNVGEGDHDVEKLQHETEEDFRLRRFTESFKQLEFGSQEYIVDNIKSTIVHDLGYHNDEPRFKLLSGPSLGLTSDDDERPPFSLEFIMVKSPNLRGGGVATTQGGGGGGGGAITQGGGDGAITQGGQGTSQQ